MRRCKEILVSKRDGTVEKFGLAKLSSCLARVLSRRSYDARLAGPLARAVALHLSEWRNVRPPSTEYIFRCVATVLEQTGLADVAEDLSHYQRARAARRRRTRVLEVVGRGPGVPWCKARLVNTLERRYGLRHTVARFLAGQVEAQVFGLDYRLVTRAFLRELVQNEVLAWGLTDEPVLRADRTVPDPAAVPPEPKN